MVAITPFILTIVSSTIPEFRSRTAITLPFLIISIINIFASPGNDPVSDYSSGQNAVFFALLYLDRVVLTPESELRFIGQPSPPDPSEVSTRELCHARASAAGENYQTRKDRDDNLLNRLIWAYHLHTSFRGIGWSWQINKIPSSLSSRQQQNPSRRSYIIRHLLISVLCVAAAEVCTVCTAAFAIPALDRAKAGDEYAWVQVIVLAWLRQLGKFCAFRGVYGFAAAVDVGLNESEMWMWPELFGRLTEGGGVRWFWGTFWHQIFRRIFKSPALFICRVFNFPKSSLRSRYTQLYVCFFLSGLLHHAGSYSMAQRSLYDMSYFMLQAVAINSEDFVVAGYKRYLRPMIVNDGERTGKRDGGSSERAEEKGLWWERCLGYVWLLVWLTLTDLWVFEPQMRYGFVKRELYEGTPSWKLLAKVLPLN